MIGLMDFILPQASTSATQVDFLIELIFVIVGVWFILAEGVLFYLIFRFRKKEGVKAQYITGEKHEENKWVHIPHNLILVFDVIIIIFAIKIWYGVKQHLPAPDETIRVIGQQWAWTFVHPGKDKILGTDDDVAKVDELRLKVGTTYHFQLTSKDVLHSFSIPAFRLKQDAIPGRIITGWFKPTKTGEYDFQCAEICGIGHGIMQAKVFVENEADHNKWLEGQKEHIVLPDFFPAAPMNPTIAAAPN